MFMVQQIERGLAFLIGFFDLVNLLVKNFELLLYLSMSLQFLLSAKFLDFLIELISVVLSLNPLKVLFTLLLFDFNVFASLLQEDRVSFLIISLLHLLIV